MKKMVLLTLLCSVLGMLNLTANEKDIIYIENFTAPESIDKALITALRNKVIEGLNAKDRFVLKDVNSEATLKPTKKVVTTKTKATKEAEAVETTVQETIDNATLAKYKKLKTNYIIKGNVTTLQSYQKTKDDGTVKYEATVVYALNMINVSTNAIEATESYKYPSAIVNLSSGSDSAEKAIQGVLGEVTEDMDKFVDRYFPVTGKVLEASKVNKDKAQEVYIDLGVKHGIQKGQKFEVFVERNIAGRIAESRVGELQAEAVEGDDLTRCKVNGGKAQEAVKEALDKGDKIVVKSMEQKKSILGEGRKMFGI